MTTDQIFHVAITVIMALASTIWWFWAKDQKSMQLFYAEKFLEIERRFAEGNKECSRLSGIVNVLMMVESNLKTVIREAEDRARQQAISRLEPEIDKLEFGKVDTKLYEAQIADLRARLDQIDRRRT